MKFIFECEDEILLPFTYDFADKAEAYFKKTKLLDIRKEKTEGLDITEQGKKNLKAMLKKMCKEYPRETGDLLAKLWVLDEGEKAPNAFKTMTKVLTNKDVLNFFSSLMGLAQ